MFSKIKSLAKDLFQTLKENHLTRGLMHYFDWPLFILVLMISLFGVVVIFSAATSGVTETPSTVMDALSTQPLTYPRLQLLWILAGTVAMFAVIFFDYKAYEKYAYWLYGLNLIVLAGVLFVEKGRGGMSAFVTWGGGDRGFQPSELGKVIMIIAFARAFSQRVSPVMNFKELVPLMFFLGLPMMLIIAQPDVGTALVYLFVFCIMILVSGTNGRMIIGVIVLAVLLVIPLWYFMNNSGSDSFRLTRFLIWLDPDSYPDEARQVVNGQIALGSGGVLGKGIVSPGSFASLGYISDDHTDFIFAIVGESFGLVGTCALVLAYLLIMARLFYYSFRIEDPYAAYIIVGVLGMLMFHVFENVCMVIGLMPVTGIPLPFVSYGGSNMLTNMMAIGLAENVIMRSKSMETNRRIPRSRIRRI